MQLDVKLVGRFFFSVEHIAKFLIFTTGHPAVYEAGAASTEGVATFCVTNSYARRVCNINKFAAETCPKRAIPKGSAGATRKRRTRDGP